MSTTFTTTQNEFALLLQSKLRNDSANDRLQETLQATLQRQDIKSQTLNEIRQLRQTVSEIEDAFEKISRDLYSFDRKRFRGEDGNVLQLSPQWTGHHTVCIWSSSWLFRNVIKYTVAALQADHGAELQECCRRFSIHGS